MKAEELRRLPAGGWIPLAIGMFLLIGIAVLTTRTILANERQTERAAHALSVLQVLSELDAELTEANSTQRGLMLSGLPVFRDRYEDSLKGLARAQANLESLLAGDAPMALLLARLDAQVIARRRELDLVDTLVRQGRREEALARILVARGQTDAFRATVEEIAAAFRARLEGERVSARQGGRRLLILSVGGLAAAAVLVGYSIAALRRRNSALAGAYQEILELNDSLDARVRERTAELEAANDEIQRFAYIVSHDLRSPLVNIMGFTSELDEVRNRLEALMARIERDAPALLAPDEAQLVRSDMPEALRFIRSSTARMDRLTKAILAVSREGRRTVMPESVDLGQVLNGVAASLATQLAEAGGRIDIGDLPTIVSDRLAIEQLFANLLDNALKYARPDESPAVRVWGETLGPRVRVHVEDNGRGIAAADRDRVFELFRRAGPQDRPGEGIGLAHVRALARRLGGAVSLESELGQGSRFTVTLPRRLDLSGGERRAGT